jgi:hypothetical protein
MDVNKYIPTINTSNISDCVLNISADRLAYLESIEKSLPELINNALKEHKINTLKKLHEHDKLHPEAVNIRARRYAQKNREVINAKRREKRLQKKLISKQVEDASAITCLKQNSIKQKSVLNTSFPEVDISSGIIVRFDN